MREALVSSAGMRIMRLLIGTRPQTMAELIRATGVTRTAVSEQLNELVAGGYVARTMERLPGRGRPRYLYCATHAALALLCAGRHQSVIPAIWTAIDQVGGRELTRKILRRVTQSIVEQYRARIKGRTAAERLRELGEIWAEEGQLIEFCEPDRARLVLSKRSCGFIHCSRSLAIFAASTWRLSPPWCRCRCDALNAAMMAMLAAHLSCAYRTANDAVLDRRRLGRGNRYLCAFGTAGRLVFGMHRPASPPRHFGVLPPIAIVDLPGQANQSGCIYRRSLASGGFRAETKVYNDQH